MLLLQRLDEIQGVGPVKLAETEEYWLAVRGVGYGVDVGYVITDFDGQTWERGTGQFAVGGTFVRGTVAASSAGTTKVGFNRKRRIIAILGRPASTGVTRFVLTSGSGSVTAPAGATAVRVFGTAAGGNGGGGAASFLGGGGGSGQSVQGLVLPVTGGASVSYVVGGVGANTTWTVGGATYTLLPGANGFTSGGAAHGNGGNGGASFGTNGTGAVAGGAAATIGYERNQFMGGNGGGASTNNPPVGENRGSTSANGGAGGPYGVGGAANTASGNGNAATGYGAGGGGAGTSGAGGAGTGGMLIFEFD